MSKEAFEKEILDIVYNYRKAQLFYVAAKLNISTILRDGPKSSDQIAEITNSDPETLYRVLRALASFDIYLEKPNRMFELTDKGAMLSKEVSKSTWINVIMRMEEYNWRPWGELLYSVQTGKNSFEKIFGQNLFEYLDARPEASQVFSQAMGIYTDSQVQDILIAYDFSSYQTIADIGGSRGDLLNAIMSKHSQVKGTLFDLPNVVQHIDLTSFEESIRQRLDIVEGSFFDGVPENQDLYILKKIIHDWDDEHSISILKNCYNACSAGARILIIESVLDREYENYSNSVINDIHMLVQTIDGKERTKEEYDELLKAAGFKPLNACQTYVEAEKE